MQWQGTWIFVEHFPSLQQMRKNRKLRHEISCKMYYLKTICYLKYDVFTLKYGVVNAIFSRDLISMWNRKTVTLSCRETKKCWRINVLVLLKKKINLTIQKGAMHKGHKRKILWCWNLMNLQFLLSHQCSESNQNKNKKPNHKFLISPG